MWYYYGYRSLSQAFKLPSHGESFWDCFKPTGIMAAIMDDFIEGVMERYAYLSDYGRYYLSCIC
jgi:hypothetical protein